MGTWFKSWKSPSESRGRLFDALIRIAFKRLILNQSKKNLILVVDDEVDLCNIIGAHLEFSGFDYVITTSGTEALSLVKTKTFDMIICDFVMPEMDGFEFFKQTRALGLKTPFVFCSGLDESPYKNDCPQGVIAFMQKPFSMDALMNTITKFLLPS